MIKGYYVNLQGAIITVLEQDGKLYNPWDEVIVIGDTVIEGAYEPDGGGFRVDEEYTLWTNLKELAECLEK